VRFGALLEILLAIAGIGTAVTLFPILKRQNESAALDYVASRVLESTIIVVGLISLLSIVTVRQKYAGVSGADSASVIIAGRSLVAFHNWTFLLGPAFCAGFGNGMLLGYLMYRSGLVPRRMTYLGLIGGPLVFAFGDRHSVRGLHANVHLVGPRNRPGVPLGVVDWHLARRERIHAISDPRGGCQPRSADILIPGHVSV
jgi:Domain of unknown function (DUF4386)